MEKDNTVVIMPDDDYQKVTRILWPTAKDRERVQQLTLDRPPVADMQYYYVDELDRSTEKQNQIDSFIATSQQYLLNTSPLDIKKSQDNWFHALLFNFDVCGMNEDLEHAIQFILKKYEPLDLKETVNSHSDWHFVQKAFQLVLNCRSPLIKIFLLLALVTWETELGNEIEKLCPRKNFKLIFNGIQNLVEEVVMSPFNRTNIGYRIQFFLVKLCNLCCMNILPGLEALSEVTEKAAKEQEPEFEHTEAFDLRVQMDAMDDL